MWMSTCHFNELDKDALYFTTTLHANNQATDSSEKKPNPDEKCPLKVSYDQK